MHSISEFEETYTLKNLTHGTLTLDLGCGLGKEVYYKNFYLIGIDISKERLKKAKEKRIMVVLGDGRYLPFKNKSFKTIFCHQVIEHIFEDQVFLNEAKRVLNGRMVISTTKTAHFRRGYVNKKFKIGVKLLTDEHVREYHPSNFKRKLKRSGMEVLDLRGYGIEFIICLDTLFKFAPSIYLHWGKKLMPFCRFLIATCKSN